MGVRAAIFLLTAILAIASAFAKPQAPRHSCNANMVKQRAKNRMGFSDLLQCVQDSNLDPCHLPEVSELSVQEKKVIYNKCAGPLAFVQKAAGMDTDVLKRNKRRKSKSSTEESTTTTTTDSDEESITTPIANGGGNGGLGGILNTLIENIFAIIGIALGVISTCIDAIEFPSDIACIFSGISLGLLAGTGTG